MMHSYDSMKQLAFLDSDLDNLNFIVGIGGVGREKAPSIWRRGRSDILGISIKPKEIKRQRKIVNIDTRQV